MDDPTNPIPRDRGGENNFLSDPYMKNYTFRKSLKQIIRKGWEHANSVTPEIPKETTGKRWYTEVPQGHQTSQKALSINFPNVVVPVYNKYLNNITKYGYVYTIFNKMSKWTTLQHSLKYAIHQVQSLMMMIIETTTSCWQSCRTTMRRKLLSNYC